MQLTLSCHKASSSFFLWRFLNDGSVEGNVLVVGVGLLWWEKSLSPIMEIVFCIPRAHAPLPPAPHTRILLSPDSSYCCGRVVAV